MKMKHVAVACVCLASIPGLLPLPQSLASFGVAHGASQNVRFPAPQLKYTPSFTRTISMPSVAYGYVHIRNKGSQSITLYGVSVEGTDGARLGGGAASVTIRPGATEKIYVDIRRPNGGNWKRGDRVSVKFVPFGEVNGRSQHWTFQSVTLQVK